MAIRIENSQDSLSRRWVQHLSPQTERGLGRTWRRHAIFTRLRHAIFLLNGRPSKPLWCPWKFVFIQNLIAFVFWYKLIKTILGTWKNFKAGVGWEDLRARTFHFCPRNGNFAGRGRGGCPGDVEVSNLMVRYPYLSVLSIFLYQYISVLSCFFPFFTENAIRSVEQHVSIRLLLPVFPMSQQWKRYWQPMRKTLVILLFQPLVVWYVMVTGLGA